jgi:tRNA pseudouridine55 synthase
MTDLILASEVTEVRPEPYMLLIDKAVGWTSHDVVNYIRRKTKVKRVGHAGTLDPFATGLLIVLVGREATKQQDHFLHMDKVYACTGQLGVVTDTFDTTGKVVEEAAWEKVSTVTQNDLEKVLPQFQGKIQQQVPSFSAVKVQGKKLYELARKGTVDPALLPIKEIEIFALELTNFTTDTEKRSIEFSLRVHCSSGTYIRSLIHDIGQLLQVGATTTQLRRLQIGQFSVSAALFIQK